MAVFLLVMTRPTLRLKVLCSLPSPCLLVVLSSFAKFISALSFGLFIPGLLIRL